MEMHSRRRPVLCRLLLLLGDGPCGPIAVSLVVLSASLAVLRWWLSWGWMLAPPVAARAALSLIRDRSDAHDQFGKVRTSICRRRGS
eukprot:6428946-Prymnesium_polylepis.2